jgi:hypothetical protein
MAAEDVTTNASQCALAGNVLKPLGFRDSFRRREFITFRADRETRLRAYLYSVAICHQTHGLESRKRGLIGWDFIENVFLGLAKSNSVMLEPGYLAAMRTNGLAAELGALFSDDGNPLNSTLTRAEERARFLIDAGRVLAGRYDGMATRLLEESGGFLVNNGSGLYELLGGFAAYADPMKKKSGLLVKFLSDSGLVRIMDPRNFVPIMDYHMQRVLLRMGCIEVNNPALRVKLLRRERLESDTEIRNACIEAVRLISADSGHGIEKMNDFFWPLGRSCCRETTLCHDGRCAKSPCTFGLAVDLASHDRCPFEAVCKGSGDEGYRNLWEPEVDTHYY